MGRSQKSHARVLGLGFRVSYQTLNGKPLVAQTGLSEKRVGIVFQPKEVVLQCGSLGMDYPS